MGKIRDFPFNIKQVDQNGNFSYVVLPRPVKGNAKGSDTFGVFAKQVTNVTHFCDKCH